jgi:hypothetical protein
MLRPITPQNSTKVTKKAGPHHALMSWNLKLVFWSMSRSFPSISG